MMLPRSGRQREHHDYDNPSLQHSMSSDEVAHPVRSSSRESLDAGVIRPSMINVVNDDIEPAPLSSGNGHDVILPVAPQKAGVGTKLKGLFGGKKNKKEKPPKDVQEEEEGPGKEPKGSSLGGRLKGIFPWKGRGGGGGGDGADGSDRGPVVTTPESEGQVELANPAYESSVSSPMQETQIPISGQHKETDKPPKPFTTRWVRGIREPKELPNYGDPKEDRMPLKPIQPSPAVRCSHILNAVLILGIVLGIIFVALSSQNSTLAVIGPCFLGLSIFALIGKVFFTFFWQDDPLPRLKPYVRRLEDSLGPKGGRQEDTSYKPVVARSSHYGASYGLPPEPVNMAEEPTRRDLTFDHDMGIDTTLRTAEVYPEQKAPTFI